VTPDQQDPTLNVKELTAASIKRVDDIGTLRERLLEAQLETVKAEARHVKEIGELRAAHHRDQQEAEKGRLDAQRQVDVLARETTATQSLAAIRTLESTTTSMRDTLRADVASTAAAIAASTAETWARVDNRLASLERSSFAEQGRQSVADPAMERLVQRIESLQVSRDTGAGRSGGLTQGWTWVLGAIGLVFGGIGCLGTLVGIAGGVVGLLMAFGK